MGIPLLLELRNPNPNLLLFIISDLKTLWTLGAVILAVISAFTATVVVRRKKLIPAGLRKVKSVISLPSYYSFRSDDDDDSDEESDDVDSDEDSEDEGDEEDEWKDDDKLDGQDIGWEDDSVVKLWEFDTSRGFISRNDIKGALRSKSGEISAINNSTPASVLAAEMDGDGHLAVKIWDARTAGAAPEASASATWLPERRVVGLMGKGEKVYVGDDVGKLTVVDLRNVKSTLGEIRRWSDGVMTAGERNAAMCLTLFPETG